MHCLQCGKDVGESLGLCEECTEKRGRGQLSAGPQQFRCAAAPPRRHTGGAISAYVWVIVGALLLGVIVVARPHLQASATVIKTGSELRVNPDEESGAVFNVAEEIVLRGHFFDYGRVDSKLKDIFGVERNAAFLSPTEYETLQQEYLSTGRCPASYLNGHISMLFLVAGEGEARALRSASIDKADEVTLRGNYLDFSSARFRGDPMQKMGGNFNFFYPTELVVNGAPIIP